VHIEPWSEHDLPLLERLLGDPAMMAHLGGPESPDKIAERQARYEVPGSLQFKIVEEAAGEGVGWVGYWEREWRGDDVYETGWSVVPEAQGRGIAAAATRALLERARADGDRRYVHAFPAVDNAPSNAICRKLGFELLGASEFEYPKGSWMRCNDWRFDLSPRASTAPP
jgi:RimJ/RimL family protein N-acetyltransferase